MIAKRRYNYVKCIRHPRHGGCLLTELSKMEELLDKFLCPQFPNRVFDVFKGFTEIQLLDETKVLGLTKFSMMLDADLGKAWSQLS